MTSWWRGFQEVGAAPVLHGYQAEGAAPLVHGAPVEQPETVASAIRIGNPARWEDAMNAFTASRGEMRAVTDDQILEAYDLLASREGVFCEPASAASVAGLLANGAEGRVVCVLTGHGLKDPQTAMNRASPVIPCEPDIASVESAVIDMNRRRQVRVPASSANLGPGYDALAAALSLGLELDVEETGEFAVQTDLPVSRPTARTCASGPSRRCIPADGLTFRISSDIPPSAGLGSSAAAIVAGLCAADHMYELDAPLFELARELEGHPDNVAAALFGGFVVCAGDEPARFDPPPGLEGVLAIPPDTVPTAEAREAMPAEVPMADAVHNVAHASLLVLGLASDDFSLIGRGLSDRLHQDRRALLYPRSMELIGQADELGAVGATISGAGPTVLFWAHWEQTGQPPGRAQARGARLRRAARDVRARWRGREGDPVNVEAAGGVVVRDGEVGWLPRAPPPLRRLDAAQGQARPGRDVRAGGAARGGGGDGAALPLGRELASDRYRDKKDRPKVVRYWLMEVEGGDFAANDEVDEVRWLSPAEAADLLTYDRDRGLLDGL